MWFKKPFQVEEVVKFTANAELYGSFMFRVICEWHYTTEHNLTNTSMNRKAWLGHAAAYMAIGSPETITRQAWGYLTEQQRMEANDQAQKCIDVWQWQHHNLGGATVTGPYIDSYLRKDYKAIPDDLPGELLELAPAYKFICRAILRNDQHLTTLGYSKPKCESYNMLKKIELAGRVSA